MKILFLHNNDQDYLSESVFHGLRSLLGDNCVDFPRYEIMYKDIGDPLKKKLRGNGFTLYGLLDESEQIKAARFRCLDWLENYDKIIVSNIWSQFNLLKLLLRSVPKNKIVILDGADQSSVFPYAAFYKRLKSDFFCYFFSSNDFKYFKREITENSYYNLIGHLLGNLGGTFKISRSFIPISFSVPAEKITYVKPSDKLKLFQTHIVDEEVALKIKDSQFSSIGSDKLFFEDETHYFKDLQDSKFGITTKRAGWDALRHYELAANGTVLCFKNLSQKSELCAPTGLDNFNSISYDNYDHLISIIQNLSPEAYENYLTASYQWIENNTTVKKAGYLLHNIQ